MKLKTIITLVICIVLCILYFPIEFAISYKNLPKGHYFIVSYIDATDVEWIIIGDENGPITPQYVNLIGVIPSDRYTTDIVYGINSNNMFVCYNPEYIGKSAIVHTPLNTYKIEKTKILSPIKRGVDFPFIPMPKSYICVLDFVFGKISNIDRQLHFLEDSKGNKLEDTRPSI